VRVVNPWLFGFGALIFAFGVVVFAIFYLHVPTSRDCRVDALLGMCDFYAGGSDVVIVSNSSGGFFVECRGSSNGRAAVVNISFNSGLQ